MEEQIKKVESYRCKWCGELFDTEQGARECAFNHAKYELANAMLRNGRELRDIEYYCHFGWKLTKEQETITNKNCFKMSYWQCCEKPAYQIVEIDNRGNLRLFGRGGWTGGYGNMVNFDKLPKPYSEEELFIYK